MTLLELIKSQNTIWLFDYDLTLYGFDEVHVLDSMDVYMSQYIADFLKISLKEANELRKSHWRKYGTTLNGLRATYEVNPHDFFDYIHSGENIKKPQKSIKIREHLSSIVGRRWVFTNGRRDWAQSGLDAIGISDLFIDVFDIEFFNWSGKPYPEVYQQVLDAVVPTSENPIVFLDDKRENIVTAKEFGWTTVWMTLSDDVEPAADYSYSGLLEMFDTLNG